MSAEALSQVGEASGSARSFDASAGRIGVYWRSEQAIIEPASYEAHTPAGLHIGCGIASITTQSADLGTFEFDGIGLTAMLCPDGARPFQTLVSGGSVRASGLFLSAKDLSESDYDALHDIVAELGRGAPLRASSSVPISVVSRLCAPVDPWFQGAARDLAFEARAIEMSALAASWRPWRGLFLRGEANAAGRTPLNPENFAFQGAVVLLGAQIGWETDRWTARLYVENLTDELVYTSSAYTNFAFGFDGTYYAGVGKPRVVGLQVSHKW